MKRGILIGSIAGLAVLAGSLYINTHPAKEYYEPREAGIYNDDGANGAMAWLHARRANQETGEINPADVMAAREAALNLKSKAQSTLHWGEMGPTNIGGRTRAFLFDKDNPSIQYSGSVSGGLFRSTTGGSSWFPLPNSNNNQAVVSICQAPDGTIYYGTGEGLYYGNYGSGSGGILGGGIYKSTDGVNFNVLPKTIPTPNSTGSDWASVGKLATDPVNSQRIYAATNNGLKISSDGGNSWDSAFAGGFGNSAATDLVVTPSGKVWLKQGAHVFLSQNGDPGTYVQVTVNSNNSNDFRSSPSRIRIAVAPQDENYVYAIAATPTNNGATFRDAWQSKDGGATWRKIGEASIQLNPHRDQANYNNAVGVSPLDKERIIVGGVELWEWSESNGWLQIASLAGGPGNSFYVHADNHDVIFHPTNPSVIMIVNDGGIFRSTNNGVTWAWVVNNYITTQYYNIAVGAGSEVMGGTQDNGTILIDPAAPLPKRGVRTPGIAFRGRVVDGDGGYAEMSKLDPRIRFKAMQYGVIGRSIDGGESFSFVLSNDVDPMLRAGSRTFADFVTPFSLWEKLNDPLSTDSVTFVADSVFTSVGFGNGKRSFTGTIAKPQASGEFLADGMVIRVGNNKVFTSDANGNLIGPGSGTFNAATGNFNITFNDPVNLEILIKAAIRYPAGSRLSLSSAINELPVVVDSLPTALEPMDSFTVQDPVQSMFAVGVTAFSAPAGAIDRNEIGGIWITRNALSDIFTTPTWYHIATLGNGVVPNTLTFSPDGDALWVGASNGVLYRLSNLNAARDSASTSVNDYYVGGQVARSHTSVVEKTVVRTFPGRSITDVAIHPDNPDLVVVTLGNYGNNNYLYYSSNATSASPTLTVVNNDIPKMPLYTASFNYKSGNPNEVYVGSDLGVFGTNDITAASTSWTMENAGMANVPVFDLVQERTIRYDLKGPNDFEGNMYAGTHGRGIYMTNSLSGNVVGTPEITDVEDKNINLLNVFPNPAKGFTNIELQLENKSDVIVSIRSITGKTVKSVNYKALDKDVENVRIDLSSVSSGTYIVSIQEGSKIRTGKLVIVK